MTLYLLWQIDWDCGDTLHGVYMTRELAEQAKKNLRGFDYEIREQLVDEMPPPYVPPEPAPVRELSPLESILRDACDRYLLAAFKEWP